MRVKPALISSARDIVLLNTNRFIIFSPQQCRKLADGLRWRWRICHYNHFQHKLNLIAGNFPNYSEIDRMDPP
jgi:hypothetical protein